MNHSTNIVWGERGELFLHEKALRAYFCAGVHIILARIVDNHVRLGTHMFDICRLSIRGQQAANPPLAPALGVEEFILIAALSSVTLIGICPLFI